MSFYGFGVDNFLSVNLVTAHGDAIILDASKEDLWWALPGSRSNFGIVTSAKMKAYPAAMANNTHWLGPLIFTEDKIESLIWAIDDLHLKPEMAMLMYYATTGSPDYGPIIIAFPFYVGGAQDGKSAEILRRIHNRTILR
jgi:FAD/FMN-containing dehydrogenase